MYRLLIIMIVLMGLVACGASNERPEEQQNETVTDNTTAVSDSTSSQGYKVTFLELGAESCIPCKMMQPVLREIAAIYPGVVDVIFHDLYKNRSVGQQYGVRVMPTQIFLDAQGKEFYRHEGFFPKDEIVSMLDEYLAGLERK
ncbi:MAG: thioredoxin [Candidatus Cloacimonetes bacterium HGW-Cloacimonetes-2]|nr:MAG: thioredoxin [Candidatus Cloacimonetes bacterium HGW-Cloacimonetes-2]